MRVQNLSKSVVCCFMACVAGSLFFSTPNQANADITYTITGFANNLGPDDGSLSGEVALGEAFTAVFGIDDSAPDFNPDPGSGLFTGAITSSSIDFSGGYSSTVDFTGGNVQVAQSNPGGGIFLFAPEGNGSILLVTNDPFESDGLLNTPQELSTGFGSLWSLEENDGGLVVGGTPFPSLIPSAFARSEPVIGNGAFVLTVSAVPEPSSMALLGLGLVIASVRRRKS